MHFFRHLKVLKLLIAFFALLIYKISIFLASFIILKSTHKDRFLKLLNEFLDSLDNI